MRTNSLPMPGTRGFGKFVAPTPEAGRKGLERRNGCLSRNLSWHREVPGRLPDLPADDRHRFCSALIFVAMGRMLIGMGLMKLGVFSGQRSRAFYIWMVAHRLRHRLAAHGLRRLRS